MNNEIDSVRMNDYLTQLPIDFRREIKLWKQDVERKKVLKKKLLDLKTLKDSQINMTPLDSPGIIKESGNFSDSDKSGKSINRSVLSYSQQQNKKLKKLSKNLSSLKLPEA